MFSLQFKFIGTCTRVGARACLPTLPHARASMLPRAAYFYLQEAIVWAGGLSVAGSLYYIFFVRKGVEESLREASNARRLSVAQVLALEQPQHQQQHQQQQQQQPAALR